MDDTAPKPPVKPGKASRRAVRDTPAIMPPLAKAKPARKSGPAVPPVLAAVETAPTPTLADPAPLVPAAALVAPAPVVPVVTAPVATTPPAPTVPTTPVAAATPAPIHRTAAKEAIMETIENLTAKTQTAFADATAQAKGAVEKGQKMFEDANEFGKGNIEAMVESSKIAVRGFEALGQDAAAFAKKSFEEATVAAKTMTSVKSPTELMKLQADYARSAFDALVQQTSRNTEAMLKLAGEVAQPLSNRVALAAEKMKVVA